MRVTLENTDASRSARVTTRSIPLGSDFKPTGEPGKALQSFVIGPQKTGEVWLHNGQDAVLSEEPAPPPAA